MLQAETCCKEQLHTHGIGWKRCWLTQAGGTCHIHKKCHVIHMQQIAHSVHLSEGKALWVVSHTHTLPFHDANKTKNVPRSAEVWFACPDRSIFKLHLYIVTLAKPA